MEPWALVLLCEGWQNQSPAALSWEWESSPCGWVNFQLQKKLNEALHHVKNGIFQLIAALPHILPRAFWKSSVISAPPG